MNETTTIELSNGASSLLNAYAKDAPNWGGSPLVGGNVPHRKADDGWLTELKKKGLITTFTETAKDCGLDDDCVWLQFTDAGLAFIKSRFGIDGID